MMVFLHRPALWIVLTVWLALPFVVHAENVTTRGRPSDNWMESPVDQLVHAAAQGDIESVDLFIQAGTDINAMDSLGSNALFQAIRADKIVMVSYLLEKGADANIRTDQGLTPLIAASDTGSLRSAELLLDHQADINAFDINGTPLIHATNGGHLDIIHLLLTQGADVSSADGQGRTPLMSAAARGDNNLLQLYLSRGAEIHARTKNGFSALMFAVAGGNQEMVSLLLVRGADVNVQDENGFTPLMVAADKGDKQLVDLLLKYKAQPRMFSRDGSTALTLALKKDFDEIVESLQIVHVESQHQKLVHDLKGKGYEFTVKGYLESIRSNELEIVKLYIRAGMPYDVGYAFQVAIETGRLEIVKFLITVARDLNSIGRNGKTPLISAIEQQNLAVVRILLDQGADPNGRQQDDYYATPLMWAARKRSVEIVSLLLARGSTVGSVDNRGHTAFRYAAEQASEKIIRLLLENGADINGKDNFGVTHLMWVKSNDLRNAVGLLEQLGARANPLFFTHVNEETLHAHWDIKQYGVLETRKTFAIVDPGGDNEFDLLRGREGDAVRFIVGSYLMYVGYQPVSKNDHPDMLVIVTGRIDQADDPRINPYLERKGIGMMPILLPGSSYRYTRGDNVFAPVEISRQGSVGSQAIPSKTLLKQSRKIRYETETMITAQMSIVILDSDSMKMLYSARASANGVSAQPAVAVQKLVSPALRGLPKNDRGMQEFVLNRQWKGCAGVYWIPFTVNGKDVFPLAVSVLPGGPMYRAGVRPDDILVKINGREVGNISPAELLLSTPVEPGKPVSLSIWRGGKTLKEVEVIPWTFEQCRELKER
ncbi:ankyrin repeat domain-containing protein [Thermodesulfobacteriota bacterium]